MIGRLLFAGTAAVALAAPAPAGAQAADTSPPPGARAVPAPVPTGAAASAGLQAQLDSLREELRAHRFGESFLDTALNEQATRFALICSGLLLLFGGGTFLGSWREVKQAEKRTLAVLAQHSAEVREAEQRTLAALTQHSESVDAAIARVRKAESFMYRIGGNTYAMIGIKEGVQRPDAAIRAWLVSGACYYAAHSIAGEQAGHGDIRSREAGAASLAEVITLWNGLDGEGQRRVGEEFARDKAPIEEAFHLLDTYGDSDSKSLVARVRVLIDDAANKATRLT